MTGALKVAKMSRNRPIRVKLFNEVKENLRDDRSRIHAAMLQYPYRTGQMALNSVDKVRQTRSGDEIEASSLTCVRIWGCVPLSINVLQVIV